MNIINNTILKGPQVSLETLSVTPSTLSQSITPSVGYAYDEVNVDAVTSAIDLNIQPSNILNGVEILGVEGTVLELNATSTILNPSVTSQTVTPSSPYNGFNEVTLNAVTASIDNNIKASNIKSGVTILGVTGNLKPLSGSSLSITPSTTIQLIFPSAPYNAFTGITVSGVTSAIDPDIVASNIKSGVSILGVTGNVVELKTTNLNVSPQTYSRTEYPTSPYNGFNRVEINAVTSAIDSNIQASNIKSGVSILGVSGTLNELNATTLSASPSTAAQTFTPTSPYNGYSEVTLDAVTSTIDANIQASNIKSGVSILGVSGTYEGSGGENIPFYTLEGPSMVSMISDTVASGHIRGGVFNGWLSLNTVYLPNVCCTTASTIFTSCPLEHLTLDWKNSNYMPEGMNRSIFLDPIYWPWVSNISGNWAMYNWSKVPMILFGSTAFGQVTANYSAFRDMPSLQTVVIIGGSNFTQPIYLQQSAFANCYNLKSLYLMTSTNLALKPSSSITNVFQSTPIAGYTASTGGEYGSIYVPASLYNQYINTTNVWGDINRDRFVSMTAEQIYSLSFASYLPSGLY